jgi:hypothetical protein
MDQIIIQHNPTLESLKAEAAEVAEGKFAGVLSSLVAHLEGLASNLETRATNQTERLGIHMNDGLEYEDMEDSLEHDDESDEKTRLVVM